VTPDHLDREVSSHLFIHTLAWLEKYSYRGTGSAVQASHSILYVATVLTETLSITGIPWHLGSAYTTDSFSNSEQS
jgi:hypothetical protein